MMNIILYCQYVWGMGHLFRSVELARALSEHRVMLIAGGQEVNVELPGHVTLVRLPVLFMDEYFTTLIPGNPEAKLKDIQGERKEILFSLFEQQRPDLFIVELYPFGRNIFEFELKPLLQRLRAGGFGPVKSVCSLRDVLVEKKNPFAYEQRVLNILNEYFDLLLIHSDPELLVLDETFSRVGDIRIPVFYTGFVARQGDPIDGQRLRDELELGAGEKLMVASAGGGRAGYIPLKAVLKACQRLRNLLPLRLEVFAGPFMKSDEFENLSALSGPGIRVRRFSRRFLDYLYAADVSFSLAGYNTCMNLLATRTPALIYPYYRQREQPIRVGKIKKFLPLRILAEKDLESDRLAKHIREMLCRSRPSAPLALNLKGAENAARFLEEWVEEDA